MIGSCIAEISVSDSERVSITGLCVLQRHIYEEFSS